MSDTTAVEGATGTSQDVVDQARIRAALVGEEVGDSARQPIEDAYRRTAHKRRLPPGP